MQKIKKYKFEKTTDFPRTPVLMWEHSNTADINNPYVQSAGYIITQSGTLRIWEVVGSKVYIEDQEMIARIVKDSEDCIKNNLPVLEEKARAYRRQTFSTKEYLSFLNQLNQEVYRTYIFFNGENFSTEDKDLLKYLPELKIELSNFTERLWQEYDYLLERLEGETEYSKAELSVATSLEIESILKGEQIVLSENRTVAIAVLDNKLSTYVGEKAREVEAYLERSNALANESKDEQRSLQGRSAYPGKVSGRVVKVLCEDYDKYREFFQDKDDFILVTPMTRPEIVPYLRKAKAIVTNEGGITCHAVIVARELKTPCIVATRIATEVLQDGDLVEVDAERGVVSVLEKGNINSLKREGKL